MCRLFAFRSPVSSRVHPELVTERNSLRQQSVEHKDGWGIAYYNGRPEPFLAHGVGPAHSDAEFDRVSAMVNAPTVVAHIRLASIGEVALRNTHPFCYGRWVFAHNGTLRDFAKHAAEVQALIAPRYRALLKGETDSERCFALFLTHLWGASEAERLPSAEAVGRALVRTIEAVAAFTDVTDAPPSGMNFLVSDGERLWATRRHRTLFYSERQERGSGLPLREPPPSGSSVQQLLIASEELSIEKHWHPVPEDHVIALTEGMKLCLWPFAQLRAR
jgi:glutamine amidotransferase